MSDNNQDYGSMIIPTTEFVGNFRCGVCWSKQIHIRAALSEDNNSIIINLWCSCGNSLILQTQGTHDGNSN